VPSLSLQAGVVAAYEATGKPKYLDATAEISESNAWEPGPRPRHADDLCIAQTYAKIFLVKNEKIMIEAAVERFDAMIADPRPDPVVGWSENDNWSWYDALFMAPPTMALIADATGDLRYIDLMNSMRDRNSHSFSASLAWCRGADSGPKMGSHARSGLRYGRTRRLEERVPRQHPSNLGSPSGRRLDDHTLHGRPRPDGMPGFLQSRHSLDLVTTDMGWFCIP
jgi:hypothetical protein